MDVSYKKRGSFKGHVNIRDTFAYDNKEKKCNFWEVNEEKMLGKKTLKGHNE